MPVKVFATVKNNGTTTLNGGIDASTTTVTVTSAVNLKVDSISGTDFAYITVIDPNTYQTSQEILEIMKVTAVSGNVLTVVRGQDGTSGTAFGNGDIVEMRPVAIELQDLIDALTDGTDELSVGAFTATSLVTTGTITAGSGSTVLTTGAGLLRHQAIDPAIAGTALSAASGVLSLDNTAVTPAAYTNADITVDQQGRITAAANGSSVDLTAPGPIGSVTPSTGAFTTLSTTGLATLASASVTANLQAATGGFGIARTDGTLHVHTATAGAVAANAIADEIVAENSGDGGISVLTPDANFGRLLFGSPGLNAAAQINWKFSILTMVVGTASAGGILKLASGNNATAATFDASQNCALAGTLSTVGLATLASASVTANLDAATIGTGTPGTADFTTLTATDLEVIGTGSFGIAGTDGTLHAHTASAGSVTAHANADEIVAESSGAGGISILVPDASVGLLAFGSPTDNIGAQVQWQHSALQMTIGTNAVGGLLVLRSGNAATAGTFDANQDFTIVGAFNRTPVTITTDTTPTAVGRGVIIIGAWTAANDITDFDNETAGQVLKIIGGDTDCNIVDGSGIELVGGTAWNAAVGATLELWSNGTTWYEHARSAT